MKIHALIQQFPFIRPHYVLKAGIKQCMNLRLIVNGPLPIQEAQWSWAEQWNDTLGFEPRSVDKTKHAWATNQAQGNIFPSTRTE
jgi:hypothetical protein